jgi:hypothetical protein
VPHVEIKDLNAMKCWIYLEKELSELQEGFESIFEVNNLYRDYENVWEWIESEHRNAPFYLNISRSHDWSKGDYDQPIMILVESTEGKHLDEKEIALKIKNQFNCAVFVGEYTINTNDKVETTIRQEY